MIKAFSLALLLLAGCDKPAPRAEAGQIAASPTPSTEALENRIATLESKVRELQAMRKGDAAFAVAIYNAEHSHATYADTELDRLSDNATAFHEQIDYLRARQNLGPMPTKTP